MEEVLYDNENIGPTHWNTLDIKFLEISKDKLTVKYVGTASNQTDAGVSF